MYRGFGVVRKYVTYSGRLYDMKAGKQITDRLRFAACSANVEVAQCNRGGGTNVFFKMKGSPKASWVLGGL